MGAPHLAPAPPLDPPRDTTRPSPDPHPPVALVDTPSPHRPGRPGLTSEPTTTMAPTRARGLYPEPGLYDRMRRRNPAIDSAMTARYYRRQAKPFRVLTREGLAGPALARAERTREEIYALRGGLAGVAAEFGDRSDQFGAGLAEREWAVADNGEFRLRQLVWVEPWQIWDVQDVQGFPVALRLRGTEGLTDPIPWDAFAAIGRRDNSRLPEGHSALRCLWWRDEDIRRMLVNAAQARDRIGLGKRLWRVPRSELDSSELRNAIRQTEADLARAEERWAIIPEEADPVWDEGPKLQPQYEAAIRGHEHSIARQFGDTATEEGVAVAGARAAVVEQRKSSDQTELGQDLYIARALTRELVWVKYQLNGWPLAEAPYVWVTGWPDTDAWRALREWVDLDIQLRQAGLGDLTLLTDQDYTDIRNHMRLAFGWGADHV